MTLQEQKILTLRWASGKNVNFRGLKEWEASDPLGNKERKYLKKYLKELNEKHQYGYNNINLKNIW